MQRLPLFPLGSVLFPGLLLPLQIFEPRYRALVQHLQDGPDDRPRHFGVIAIRQGHEVGVHGANALYGTGCIASVRRIEDLDDGRYALTTVGAQRFQLHDIDTDAGTPWTTGVVTPLTETDGDGTQELAYRVAVRFATYLASMGRPTPDGGEHLQQDPRLLSYLVAAAMVLTVSDRQDLLAASTTADRLRAELALLRREAAAFSVVRSVPAVDLSRGPITPN